MNLQVHFFYMKQLLHETKLIFKIAFFEYGNRLTLLITKYAISLKLSPVNAIFQLLKAIVE